MPLRTYVASAVAAAGVLAAAVSLTASLGEHNPPETTPVRGVALTAQRLPSAADRGPRRGCMVVLTPMPPALAQVMPIPPRPGAQRPCVAL